MKVLPKYLLLLLGVLCFGYNVIALPEGDDDKKKKEEKPPIPLYLGKSNHTGGNIQHYLFDSLIRQGIVAKDSAGVVYAVDGFLLTYAERKLYEDSVGKLMVVTDYNPQYCMADTVPKFFLDILTDHTKYGDTVYIDKVTVYNAKGERLTGKPMRFELTK